MKSHKTQEECLQYALEQNDNYVVIRRITERDWQRNIVYRYVYLGYESQHHAAHSYAWHGFSYADIWSGTRAQLVERFACSK